jgi:hypothetical protein
MSMANLKYIAYRSTLHCLSQLRLRRTYLLATA